MPGGRIDWPTLARRALLRHIERGHAAHALRLLRHEARAEGRALHLSWAQGDERVWFDGAAAPAGAREHPLLLAGARVGGLWLEEPDDEQALAALLEAVAPLVELASRNGAADGASTHANPTILRAALHGAGTFVWDWQVDRDLLPDIEDGFAMLGYGPGHFEPTQQAWNRLIHPDDLEANHDAYLRHARGEVAQYEHVYRALDAQGRWRWLEERGRIVERAPDGSPLRMLGTQTDITGQRDLAHEAAVAHDRLERIASQVPGVIYQFELAADGQRGRFPYVSERCEAVFGCTAQALMEDAGVLMALVEPAWRERLRDSVLASAADASLWRMEFPIRLADGRSLWLRAAASPQREAHGATSWFGYIADVTELRMLEAASRDKFAAEAASSAKSEFLSRMSHELRTPLNAVLGFAQLLEMAREPRLAEPHRRHVRLIREAGEHLLAMIGDLLDLTRIESGQLVLAIEPTPLAALAADCVALVHAQAASAGVALTDGLHDGAFVVRTDRTRLKQVLLNLLSNAIKYNRPGGRVKLAAARDGAFVRIDVSDTGTGIGPEHLTQLFEPFQRGAHAHGPIEGTGIGLAVSRTLVELMGGRLEVQSAAGVGSTFSVFLPA